MWLERVVLRVVLVAIFIGVMFAYKEFLKAAIDAAGLWVGILAIGACLWIAWLWDRKDQRDRAG